MKAQAVNKLDVLQLVTSAKNRVENRDLVTVPSALAPLCTGEG